MSNTDEIADPVVQAFLEFSGAIDIPEIQSNFISLCREIELDPWQYDDFYSSFKSKLQQWRCKALWQLLDTRVSLPEYCNQSVCKGKRVLIIGAGPVGLRVAIEAALLGAEVDLVEKRRTFARNNVLHLWPFLMDDLRALGAKKFYGKFCAGAIDHISIKVLQSILLKVCLILGVKVYFPVTFLDLIEPRNQSDHWHVHVDPRSCPVAHKQFDAILSADGKQYSLPGFKSKEFRAKLAIAITANFVYHNTNDEAAVEEISGVAFIYNQSFFKSLANTHGIELENIVYYKDETHYFVMTAKKGSLLAKGVIKKDYNNPELLLAGNNINQTALEQYAIEAANFSTKGGLKNLKFAANHRGEHDVAIFDFTSLFALEHASRIVERKGKRILLCAAGDTLLEPFWPTGSGLGRGFLGAFDAAWMLKRYAEGTSPMELIEERETIYRLLPSTTPQRLQKKTSAYTINPHTRYPNLNLMVPPSDLSYLYDSDSTILTKEPLKNNADTSPIIDPKVKRFYSFGSGDTHNKTHTKIPHKPTLEAIRASLSPEPMEIESLPKDKKQEQTEKKKATAHTESYFMKFAKLLFGKRRKETLDQPIIERAPDSRKALKKQTPPTSPRLTARKAERQKNQKSKNKHKSKTQAYDSESREKQPPSSIPNQGTGVLELTKLYESGSVHIKHSNETESKIEDKNTKHVPKGSVAGVIERLEQNKKRDVDMTDYELTDTFSGDEELVDFSISAKEEVTENLNAKELNETENDETQPKLTYNDTEAQESDIMITENEDTIEYKMEVGLEGKDENEEMEVGDEKKDSSKFQESEESHEEENTMDLETINSFVLDETPPVISESASERAYGREEDIEEKSKENEVVVKEEAKERQNHVEDYQAKLTTFESLVKQDEHEEARPEMQTKENKKDMNATQMEYVTPLKSPTRQIVSKDDSELKLRVSIAPPTPAWQRKFTISLTAALEKLRQETDIQNVKITLEILSFIYKNVTDDPKEDTYRRIRVTSTHFLLHVWQYDAAQQFMWTCGWMEVNDYLVLPLDQSIDMAKLVLDRQIEIVNMMIQSKQLTRLLSDKNLTSNIHLTESEQEYCYTDSMVLKGLSKVNRDYSIMMANAWKEKVSQKEEDEEEVDIEDIEETDHPWISRKEEVVIIQSASQVREWWENKLKRHSSTYSLYFQHEELDEFRDFSEYGEMRGQVANRVNELEGRESKDLYHSSSEEDSSGKDEEEKEEETDMVQEDNSEELSWYRRPLVNTDKSWISDEHVIQTASQSARQIWQERSKRSDSSSPEPTTGDEKDFKTINQGDFSSSNTSDPTVMKWQAAQRISEQLVHQRQSQKEISKEQ